MCSTDYKILVLFVVDVLETMHFLGSFGTLTSFQDLVVSTGRSILPTMTINLSRSETSEVLDDGWSTQ